jgi:hypothetical protein
MEIKITSPENLPQDYIPSDDVSINGEVMKPRTEQNRLSIVFHVFSKNIADGKVPFLILIPLQERLQQYIRWSSHSIDRFRSKILVAPYSVDDWATLSLASVGTGSFRMECISNSTLDESSKISKAWQILGSLTRGEITNIEDLKIQVGEEAVFYASRLAEFISVRDLAISISWMYSGSSSGYLAFDKRRAKRILSSLDSKKVKMRTQTITIRLTQEQAEPLRRKISGTGGMQTLLGTLQGKLTKGNTIILTMDEVERIRRYGMSYGRGGFQDRLAGIARVLDRMYTSFQTS